MSNEHRDDFDYDEGRRESRRPERTAEGSRQVRPDRERAGSGQPARRRPTGDGAERSRQVKPSSERARRTAPVRERVSSEQDRPARRNVSAAGPEYSDRDQADYQAMRARKKREREERRRKERQRALILRGVLVGVLLIAVVAIIAVVAGKGGKKDSVSSTQLGTSLNEPAAVLEQTTESIPAAAETAAVNEVPVSGGTVDLKSVDYSEIPSSASSKSEALVYAKALATQYDYDGAIAMLESVTGYDTDSEMTAAIAEYTATKATCTAVDVTRVPHVFFHSLLNDDRGLRTDIVGQDRAWRNDAAMTTAAEFDAMLEYMYNAGYVLVSLNDLCIKTKNADGSTTVEKNTNLMLPPGKKALVMSEDDLSYYHTYGIGTQGYATKMVLDENGKVKCEYTDENGVTKIGDYDMVPRLDTFIHEHPDFAYKNARPTVALTGYNGVFGYRTNDYYKDINNPKLDKDQIEWLQDHPDYSWEEDVAMATKIADAMKKEGWTFASHTYGHLNASTRELERLQADHERWKTVNQPIVGDIDIIIFAFGGDIGYVNGYTADNAKYQYFKSEGFNIFCNVDGNIGWTEFGPTYMRTGRVALDGFTMYQAMTPDAPSHEIYAKDYELLGIQNVSEFFNKYRITPIDSE